jgi:cytochrome c
MEKEAKMAVKYVLLLAVVLGAGVAQAAENGLELARKNGCLACHNVNMKIVGPAYKAVAKKYRGDAKASGYLAHKVRNGGKGVWGEVPMPPQSKVSDADLKAIIAWVLSQK